MGMYRMGCGLFRASFPETPPAAGRLMDTSSSHFPRWRPAGQLLPLTSRLPALPLPVVLLQVPSTLSTT